MCRCDLPPPHTLDTSRAALTTGCLSLHAGACALICWWTPSSGRSQHRHHRAIKQQGQGQGPVDLQEGGERGWTQGWTLWAALPDQHAADAASSRLLSWAHGWWRGQWHGDLASRAVPAWSSAVSLGCLLPAGRGIPEAGRQSHRPDNPAQAGWVWQGRSNLRARGAAVPAPIARASPRAAWVALMILSTLMQVSTCVRSKTEAAAPTPPAVSPPHAAPAPASRALLAMASLAQVRGWEWHACCAAQHAPALSQQGDGHWMFATRRCLSTCVPLLHGAHMCGCNCSHQQMRQQQRRLQCRRHLHQHSWQPHMRLQAEFLW